MTPQEKVSKALRQILYRAPFYGAVLSKMKIIEDTTGALGTMATDGKHVWWSPAFVDKLEWQDVGFVLMHEADHKVQLDAWRRGHRDPVLWNIAGDAVINRQLERYCTTLNNTFRMPRDRGERVGVWFDWLTDAMTKEEVYERLKAGGKKGKGEGKGGFRMPGAGTPGQGDLRDAPGTMGEQEQAASEAMQDVIEAAMTAKLMGDLPGHVKKLLEELPEQLVNWKDELSRQIRALFGSDDWSYRRPRWSGTYQGLILPSLHGVRTPHVAVVIDTSGSFVDLIGQAYAEIKAILVDCQPEKVTVIQADAAVQHVAEYENAAELGEPEWHGGGGTDFRPACKKAQECGANAIVYITDLAGTFPEEEIPGIVWCAIGPYCGTAPWGRVVRVQS